MDASTPWIGVLDTPPAYEDGLEFVELTIGDDVWQFRYYTIFRGRVVQCGTVYAEHEELIDDNTRYVWEAPDFDTFLVEPDEPISFPLVNSETKRYAKFKDCVYVSKQKRIR